MTSMAETAQAAARRPASGIVIDPEQLTRMRDLVPLSREDLAERTGQLLFDRARFAGILSGRLQPDARIVRALWLALDCDPSEIITGIPLLAQAEVPRWLRKNPGAWTLGLDAVRVFMFQRDWDDDDLATAVGRFWFSRDSVNKIERGERRPKARTLAAFCKILDCKPADLMPGSRELPEGQTGARMDLLNFNAGMRAYADAQDPPVSYRDGSGRIKYPAELREKYAAYLAGQDDEALAS